MPAEAKKKEKKQEELPPQEIPAPAPKPADPLDQEIKELNEQINNLQENINRTDIAIAKIPAPSPEELDRIAELRAQCEESEQQLDKYCKYMVNIAGNFLYLPYSEKGINEIALPLLPIASKAPVFKKYEIRFQLIQSYKADQKALVDFLGTHRINQEDARNVAAWTAKTRAEFMKLPVVVNYTTRFGEGWEETYLGQYINRILSALKLTLGPQIHKELLSVATELNNI